MKAKKGVMSWIVVVILFLAVTLVILGLIYKIKVVGESALRKGVCKLSVEKLALGKKIPLFGKELTGYRLDCEREELVFKKSETQDEKSEKLAKAITRCMDNFWEGGKDFTDNDWMTGATHCAICSKIKLEAGAGFDQLQFSQWLQEHNLPNTNMAYQDYFNSINSYDEEKKTFRMFNILPPAALSDPLKEYYLFFYINQKESKIEQAAEGTIGSRWGWLSLLNPYTLVLKISYEESRWLNRAIFGTSLKQVSSFNLEPIDNALKECENLLN